MPMCDSHCTYLHPAPSSMSEVLVTSSFKGRHNAITETAIMISCDIQLKFYSVVILEYTINSVPTSL